MAPLGSVYMSFFLLPLVFAFLLLPQMTSPAPENSAVAIDDQLDQWQLEIIRLPSDDVDKDEDGSTSVAKLDVQSAPSKLSITELLRRDEERAKWIQSRLSGGVSQPEQASLPALSLNPVDVEEWSGSRSELGRKEGAGLKHQQPRT